MLLAVDVGNSSIKFGVFKEDMLLFTFWCMNSKLLLFDLVDQIRQSFNNEVFTIHDIDVIAISSVVAHNRHLISQALSEIFIARQVWLDSSHYPQSLQRSHAGVNELGVDLAMGMVGAQKLLPATETIIVDLGTATTFVAMGADGALWGVTLLAGLRVTLRALSESAAALPNIEAKDIYANHCMALNTVDAMLGGTYYAHVGALKEIIGRMSAELNSDASDAGHYETGSMPKIVGTGGYSVLLSQDIAFDLLEPNLVLYGIKNCCIDQV